MTQPTDYRTMMARRWAVEIDMNPLGVADWQPLLGVEDLKPKAEQRREDDEDYADDGAAREAVTGTSWGLELKVIHRAGIDGVTENPVHAYLRAQAAIGDAYLGETHVRYFERSGVGEAWDGRALVTWAPDGGKGRDTVAVNISGQGKRVAIPNPNLSPLPVIYVLTPATGPAAGGTPVVIKGRKLSGATAVTFGGTAATNFVVVDDTRIVATSPARPAGNQAVVVTTPGGASVGVNFLYV